MGKEIETLEGLPASESCVEIRDGERGRMDDVALYYSARVEKFPLLTAHEEHTYTTSYFENRNPVTMELLINHNLRLVFSRARRFLWSKLELSDLVQEGVIGLMGAIERFEPVKGFRLSTFATHHIDNMIRRYVQGNANQIWVPVNVQILGKKIRKEMNTVHGTQFEKEKQVALKLGISVEKLQKTVIASSFDFMSLSNPVGEDGVGTFGDLLIDSVHSTPCDVASLKSELRQALEEKAYVYGVLSGFVLI
ncbi:MAG: sigma-70 family RNA polymerase sigma factor, partial [Minisyncoccia bacterium]